jgi:NAD(P)-dependent dehydrogenase (short-subunit alcohol dehydrogenase family)
MTAQDQRVAVVTGAASGIGLATCHALAAEGYRLVLADVEPGPLAEATASLATTTDVVPVEVDVRDRDAVARVADLTYERFGRADVVFNNAGIATGGPVVETTHDDWRWTIDVNLWGPIHGVEAFLPRMVEAGRGHLLFTASFAGLVPNLGLGAYCVSKYGVVALAEVLHRELRDRGIGVSVLCPMIVTTNIGTSARNRPPELGGGLPPPEREAPGEPRGTVLSAGAVAEQVVAAIGTDRLYIVTHPESRPMIRRRFDRIDSAFER